MKKSKLLMLLSSAVMLFAAVGVTSCVDDNDDLGMPYLEVSPKSLQFDANGTPIGASEFVVKSNRTWTLDIPAEAQWVRPSVTSGEGDGTVSFNLFASSVGQSAELTFSLKNSAGFAYKTEKVTIVQGDAPKPGPVGELVQWIIDNKIAAGSLNYPIDEIEAVILANNVYGNNFGKLYVGDNTTLPNSGMILYNTTDFNKANSANYPVGKRVKLNLKDAEYAPFNGLREIKGVKVTVLDGDPETINYPTLSVQTFLSGNYQGQYVKVLDVTPQAAFVGQAWATSEKRAVKMTSGSNELQSYMSKDSDATDFATMIIADKTGAIFGVGEQNYENPQIIPTKPTDVAELSVGGDQPSVTTGNATEVTTTSATLAGSSLNLDAATEVGVEYKLATATEWTKKAAATVSSDWTVEVTGLTENSKYTYRAYAVAGTVFTGAEKEFTTKGTSDADIMVDFTDKSSYPEDFPDSYNAGTTVKEWNFGGYTFTLSPGTGDKAKYYGGDALFIAATGYIQLPAIANKALTKVVVTSFTGQYVSKAAEGTITDIDGTTVSGGETQTWNWETSPTVTYELSGTAVNTAYQIRISNKNAQIAKLELYYGTGGEEKPSITPPTASMEFDAAADATGKTQVYQLKNATGLTLFADVADKTNFEASVENGNTVRVKTLKANDGAARTTTVNVYLAENASGEKKATATINVTQAGATPTTATPIADVIAGGADKEVLVQGQIVGTHAKGFVVKDNTGILYVFLDEAPAFGVGATVKVEGTTAEFGNLVQLGKGSVVTLVSEGTYEQPAPEVLNAAAIDAYVKGTAPLPIKYVQYSGTLSISGNYYNVTVAGASAKGSLVYVPDGLVDPDLNGQSVIVKGYAIGTPNTNRNYLNTLGISVTLDKSAPVSTLLAEWVFSSNTNLSAANINATDGNTDALLSRVGNSNKLTFTGSSQSIYCGGWDDGATADKYWLLTIPHAEAIPAGATLELNWGAWGTKTSPKNWVVEYSTDNTTWNTIGSEVYTDANKATHAKTLDLTNQIAAGTLYIRFKVVDNVSIENKVVAATGNSRMANISVAYAK